MRMKQPQQAPVRYAVASREWGLRRVRRLTWGIAGAGAVGAVALVVGFSGHVHLPKINSPAQTGQAPAGNQGTGGGQQAGNQGTGGGQQAGNQGTGGGQQAGNQGSGGGQLQPPAANPAPAQGPGQVVSGGS
jgi:hypothetical protein